MTEYEWKEHDNKGMPEGLNVDDLVIAVLNDGYELSPLMAGDLDWAHHHDNIVKWRMVHE